MSIPISIIKYRLTFVTIYHPSFTLSLQTYQINILYFYVFKFPKKNWSY